MDSLNGKLPSIKQLQCFLIVAQELNFRKAAERLRMTQPPLTRQIQSLEENLGCALFIRNTHEVRLTPVGIKLVEKAAYLLGELKHFISEINNENTDLCIGLTRTLNFDNIPRIASKIQALINGQDFDIQNQTSSQLLQSLSRGEMDMIITGEKSLHREQDFDFYWIYREPLLVAMPSAHAASLQEKVSLTDLADLPLFWFPRSANPAFYDKCESYFQQMPFSPKKLKEPDDSLVLLSSIVKSKGVALMPRSMCTFNQQGLCYRELTPEAADALNIDVYLVTRKNEERERVKTGLQSLME